VAHVTQLGKSRIFSELTRIGKEAAVIGFDFRDVLFWQMPVLAGR
jgi:hypothetical protein